MNANRNEVYELTQRVLELPPEQQMMVVEEILRTIRKAHFTDHEALDREMAAMVADPAFQRVLNNQDLPYPEPRAHEAG